MKYRKKPVVIDAIQFTGTKENIVDIFEFMDINGIITGQFRGDNFIIKTLEGEMQANIGDWIIKGVASKPLLIENQ